MEINKQLFEDVLSGKLKGEFVLRNGNKCDFSKLHRNTNKIMSYEYPYTLHIDNCVFFFFLNYTINGKSGPCIISSYRDQYEYDIIDFIPDTDMKENELTIEIPEGKIVDWEESKKQNKIVLKDKQLTYKEICEKLFGNAAYYTTISGEITSSKTGRRADPNNATTAHQLECILAKNMLANVAVYLNDGWKPNKGDFVFSIAYFGDFNPSPIISMYYFGNGGNLILFKTQRAARQAIEILGEETVKLALEPLGV